VTWLLWRQHRSQAAVAAIGYALFAILLGITGVHMANTYHAALAGCRATDSCGDLNLFSGDGAIIDLVNLSAAVPLLIGLFWGVTSVGRELDTGTHLLVWTQSVRQRDWLRGKIATLLAMALIWGAAVSAIVTWWSGTLNSLEANRFDPGKFDAQGVVPVAFALFGASLGLAAGAVIRRVLPALAVTVVGFIAVRLSVVSYIRPHYLAAKVATVPAFRRTPDLPTGSWTLSRELLVNGRPLSGPVDLPAACRLPNKDAVEACIQKQGLSTRIKYQPASHYWPFQWIESGIFVALAAMLIVVAVMAVRRRDA
jgi:hypothetical protein